MISSRSELYKNFLLKSIINDLNGGLIKEGKQLDLLGLDSPNPRLKEAEKFIKNCNLSCYIQELVGQYSVLENYFMTENIYKAIQMDTTSNDSKTSSVVDDVFFIIKKCLKLVEFFTKSFLIDQIDYL